MRYALSGKALTFLWFLAAPAGLALLLAVIFRSSASVNALPDPQAARAAVFLSDCGWSLEETACETAEITVPERFNAVYESYNALQQSQGFDLAAYRGRRLRRITFPVTNYPGVEGCGPVRANVLMDGMTVVAADICSVALGGFIRGALPSG